MKPKRPTHRHKEHDSDRKEFHRLFKRLGEIGARMDEQFKQVTTHISNKTKLIMATQKEIVAELEAKADAIQASLDDKQAKIDAGFTALKQQVADLQAQIEAGGTIDLGPLSVKLDALAVDLASTPEG